MLEKQTSTSKALGHQAVHQISLASPDARRNCSDHFADHCHEYIFILNYAYAQEQGRQCKIGNHTLRCLLRGCKTKTLSCACNRCVHGVVVRNFQTILHVQACVISCMCMHVIMVLPAITPPATCDLPQLVVACASIHSSFCFSYSKRNKMMQALSSQPQLVGRAARRPLTAKAVIAPSKPQQATAKKAPSVNARVQYVKPAPNGEELFIYLYEKPEGVDRVTNLEHIECEVPFTDQRTVEDQSGEFTLQRNGFQLEKLHVPSDIDWQNEQDVSFNLCVHLVCTEACFAHADIAHPCHKYKSCVGKFAQIKYPAGCCQVLSPSTGAFEAHSWSQQGAHL